MAGIGTIASLATNTDSSLINTKMVDGTGDSTRRRRHCRNGEEVGDNRSG